MTTYTDVFGGANIYPSDISYRALTLTADVQLHWPDEADTSSEIVARIMDLSAASAHALTMPSAAEASPGETVLFNNVGAATVTIKDAAGTQIATIAAGTAWQIYLIDNTTAAGSWRVFQYGATVSQANASSLAGTGIVAVGAVLSQSVPLTVFNSDYTASATDRAKGFVWTGVSGTLTLADAVGLGNNWFILFRNSGTGAVTVDPSGSPTIDGDGTKSFQPGESAIIVSDGADFYTVGYGRSAAFAFDYTTIDVAGTGTYTLTGSELNRISYNFTGALTGNREVIVPNTVQQYWVGNSTTGSYTLTVKTAAGTGVAVPAGTRVILYSDGADVLNASTSTVAGVIAVTQGGTGATTAGGALINLGGSSLGISVFTAANGAAAYTALGDAPAINAGTY